MSAVCTCTSSRAGSAMSGSGTSRTRRSASVAAAAILSRASSGCSCAAANRVIDSFTTTRSAPLKNGPPSAVVCWSPVISTTGAAQAERDQPVDPALPAFGAVQLDLRYDRRVVRVRQHRAVPGDRPVVADEEHRVHRRVHALHHVARLVPPGDVQRPAVQLRGVEVVHRPVRVVAHDLGGAARQRPVDRRVDLAEQQRAALLVRLAGRRGTATSRRSPPRPPCRRK